MRWGSTMRSLLALTLASGLVVACSSSNNNASTKTATQAPNHAVLATAVDHPTAVATQTQAPGTVRQTVVSPGTGSASPTPSASLQSGASPAASSTTPSTQAPATSGVAFTSVNGARPGGQAAVNVQTSPNARCSLSYTTPAGTASTAQGLGPATADASGHVLWSWTIAANTQPGAGSLAVTCTPGGSTSTTIPIG
jgi:hypothetical protein